MNYWNTISSPQNNNSDIRFLTTKIYKFVNRLNSEFKFDYISVNDSVLQYQIMSQLNIALVKNLKVDINIFTMDDEYFRHNRKNLPLPLQMQLSEIKDLLLLFYCIFGICIKFCAF